jgi:DNA replication protein DnaC/DNA-directed RNA polymerase subunit RPC12/RpoP
MEMESIKDIINRSQGTNHQGPSVDCRKSIQKPQTLSVIYICKVCGKNYPSFKQVDCYGESKDPTDMRCSICREKEMFEIRQKQALVDLPNVIEGRRSIWAEQAKIPGIFIDIASDGFEKFNSKLQPKAFNAIKNFNGKSIILSSPNIYGVGKTHLVCCLAWYLIENCEAVELRKNGIYKSYDCPVHFTTENNLLNRIRSTYDHKYSDHETEQEAYSSLSKYNLLIIDDVGKVRPKDYSFLQGVYFNIIDGRYVNEQSIILTTNLSLLELEEHIGGASADRLKEMCGKENIITMEGKSYRGNTPQNKTFYPEIHIPQVNKG